MKKIVLGLILLLIAASAAWADPVTLSATGGVGTGKDVFDLNGVTFGNTLTFEYQFLSVTWAGQGAPYLNVNGKDLLDLKDFNDYQNAPTGVLVGTIDTSGVSGQTGTVAFTADTFNYPGNSVTLLIQNVKVDGVLVGLSSAVPEPSSLLLIGTGLLGGVLRRIRRR
jgi:hypothetical protein